MSERTHDEAEGADEDAATAETRTEAQALAQARRIAKSTASAGDRDLRDAETYRALHDQEDR